MSAAERAGRTAAADALCAQAYADHAGPDVGVALVAVGGYGRGELAPYSDLDAVLVHADHLDPGGLAERLWYPLWDGPHRLDHSVRSFTGMADAAASDLRVALGLLDLRHVAGDPNLTLRLRTTTLAAWRRDARRRLPELAELLAQRHRTVGELAHAAVPDVKEAQGGLRDATVLKALETTWLVDASYPDLESGRQALLDLRDHVQLIAGRASDRIAPEMWVQLVQPMELADAHAVQVHVRELGRRITHLSRLTWRRVDDMLARPTSVRGARRPELVQVARGLALSRGEVVLDGRVAPRDDAVLLLRAAAVAAERDVVLAPATAARLARECPALPDPWPEEARSLLVRLLASGRGLLGVWETLEETGALPRILPEWNRLRSLPHASVIHRFTVDRHVVETCIEAAALIREVARPDLLMVAALLHDIGKGDLRDHSVVGESLARTIATRIGFETGDVEAIAALVRWHLLLADLATTRDLTDPTTTQTLTDRVPSQELLALLTALTEADARATTPKAWSTWRATLVRELSTRARQTLAARPERPATREEFPVLAVPGALEVDRGRVEVVVDAIGNGSRIQVLAIDRVGLLADISAVLAVQRIPVQAARAWPQGAFGISEWHTSETDVDPRALRERLQAVADGRVDAHAKVVRSSAGRLDPVVVIHPNASRTATVLEARTDDAPGVVHLVCAALAGLDLSVRSAHVSTIGPQAVDVFYVQEPGAGPLSDRRSADAAHAVRAALNG